MAEPTTLRELVQMRARRERARELADRRGTVSVIESDDDLDEALALLRDCRTALDWQRLSTHGTACVCTRCTQVTTLRERLREDTDAG